MAPTLVSSMAENGVLQVRVTASDPSVRRTLRKNPPVRLPRRIASAAGEFSVVRGVPSANQTSNVC